ncbi:PPOX class F420-dependent oxidoreductase [Saccharopolyspora rhizosphaerae]|uniref:PPOX class F420-dependent oxidoreductase n=1 Tax=Saccharopolyspora rhizosphaerae TaxID=2492662 RepID=A0A426JVQ8_9PSEU|nr:PPOX class F420-dependent oxidoreductase [Saccharopolyspora rhizosphaerae]RRO17236.1 PPOX class F420-dependent oxidoreductase [Saccharopolyspora rhizosphaerae]
MFTEDEIAYIHSQPLARIATVSPDGQPDVAPVEFEFDGHHLYVGGITLTRTRKYRNVRNGQEKVALVIDDLAALQPWTPRFLRVHGTAEITRREGAVLGFGPYLQISPTTSWSWNLSGTPITDAETAKSIPTRRTEHAPVG